MHRTSWPPTVIYFCLVCAGLALGRDESPEVARGGLARVQPAPENGGGDGEYDQRISVSPGLGEVAAELKKATTPAEAAAIVKAASAKVAAQCATAQKQLSALHPKGLSKKSAAKKAPAGKKTRGSRESSKATKTKAAAEAQTKAKRKRKGKSRGSIPKKKAGKTPAKKLNKSSEIMALKKCQEKRRTTVKALKKWIGNCQEKKRATQKREKRCWTMMLAGMARRKVQKLAAKARMKKAMAKRKIARDRMKQFIAKQAGVIKTLKMAMKTMKAEVTLYQELVTAVRKKGESSELGDSSTSTFDFKAFMAKLKAKQAAASSAAAAAAAREAQAAKAKAAAAAAKSAAKAAADAAKKANALSAKKAAAAEKASMKAEPVVLSHSPSTGRKVAECDRKTKDGCQMFVHKPWNKAKASRPTLDWKETHATVLPRCATQISVRTHDLTTKKVINGRIMYDMVELRDQHTCTSCKPGHFFILQYHKSMAGKCEPYDKQERSFCTMQNPRMDYKVADLLRSTNVLCTKGIEVPQLVQTYNMDDKAKNYFNAK